MKLLNILKESTREKADKWFNKVDAMLDRVNSYMDEKLEKAPGATRSEKLQWLWKNDASWAKLANISQKLIKIRRKEFHPDTYKAEQESDQYYVRFGDIPKGGKSKNHLLNILEKGVSAYPVFWSKEHDMWELNTDDLSEIGINTLNNIVVDFFDGKGRPLYLIYAKKAKEHGIHDTEPLLDINSLKIIKKLNPDELWIDEFYGNEWANIE